VNQYQNILKFKRKQVKRLYIPERLGGNQHMTTVEKINYMIACLQIAKEEAEYLEHYKEREQKVSEDHDKWWSWYCKNRVPNKALIKDNLRNAARTGFVVAKMVEKNGN